MQAIIRDAVQHFKYQKNRQFHDFFKKHPLYDPDDDKYLDRLTTMLKQQLGKCRMDEEQRLALHFTQDINKTLFQIFRVILAEEKGISYAEISKKINKDLDIITVSHYCRKLLRTGFVSVDHVKDGIIVKSKLYCSETTFKEITKNDDENIEEPSQQTFIIKEFNLSKNILLNLSSADALQMNGMTKEYVSTRVGKQSEKKTISRIIDNCPIYKRQGQRKGKVYEYRFKAQTEEVQKMLDLAKVDVIQSGLDNTLLPNIQIFIEDMYPSVVSDNILLKLIQTNIKKYNSSIGPRDVRRQCPPSKMARYITILNCLNEHVEHQNSLLQLIIDREKDAKIGTMHKRTLVGMLDDMQLLKLINVVDQYVYPQWKTLVRQEQTAKRNAKPDLSSHQRPNKKRKFTKISQSKNAYNLFCSMLANYLHSAYLETTKSCFKILKKNKRVIREMESDRVSLLHILQQKATMPKISFQNLNDFEDVCNIIDRNMASYCKKSQLQLDRHLKKHLRTHYYGNSNTIVRKYGKESLQELIDKRLLRKEGQKILDHQAETPTADEIQQGFEYELHLTSTSFLI